MVFNTFGGDKRDRTADLLNAIQALSQLSYTPKCLLLSDSFCIITQMPDLSRGLRKFFSFFQIFLRGGWLDKKEASLFGKSLYNEKWKTREKMPAAGGLIWEVSYVCADAFF